MPLGCPNFIVRVRNGPVDKLDPGSPGLRISNPMVTILRDWVENDLKENIYDRLENNTYSESFVSRKFIGNLLNNERTFSREKRAKMLWNLYSLEVWYSNFLYHSVIE